MPWIDALVPAEARYKAAVMQDTWGHLAPERNKRYRGYVIWAFGEFGNEELNSMALKCEFKGLDYSPWFFDALTDFMDQYARKGSSLFRFDGYMKNYEFVGTVTPLQIPSKPTNH